MSTSSVSSGTQKMIAKLENSVETGNFYEAQQMYKSVYARYMGQKKYSDGFDLLQAGACIQLKHNQVTCGTELGLTLIEAFEKRSIPVDDESLGRIRAIYEAYPRKDKTLGTSSSADANKTVEDESQTVFRVQGCSSFLRAAIKWSSNNGGPANGSPEIHAMLAQYLWSESSERDLSVAGKHFVHGRIPIQYASAVIEVMGKVYQGEIDLVVTGAVLQYLAMGNLRDANLLFDEIQDKSKRFVAPPIPDSPLIHFLKFLLVTLERDALPLFEILRKKYKPSLNRDPLFNQYVDEIALRFYNVPIPSGMNGLIGDMMKMFMGGG